MLPPITVPPSIVLPMSDVPAIILPVIALPCTSPLKFALPVESI